MQENPLKLLVYSKHYTVMWCIQSWDKININISIAKLWVLDLIYAEFTIPSLHSTIPVKRFRWIHHVYKLLRYLKVNIGRFWYKPITGVSYRGPSNNRRCWNNWMSKLRETWNGSDSREVLVVYPTPTFYPAYMAQGIKWSRVSYRILLGGKHGQSYKTLPPLGPPLPIVLCIHWYF